ncbi:MAG: VTT domain-containing protein [Dissulfuribacterales bacterium]
MEQAKIVGYPLSDSGLTPDARIFAEKIAKDCVECGLCQKDCAFLKGFKSPREMAVNALVGKLDESTAFECSLCGLCQALCPKGLETDRWMLELRRIAHKKGIIFSEHNVIRGYEKRGVSPLFTFYALPANCETVFFPGCSLPGTRPEQLKHTFSKLQGLIPNIGIVLDCCTKPSHDLGEHERFLKYFSELTDFLSKNGINQVVVACPNCFKVFNTYGRGIRTLTVYEIFRYHLKPADRKGDEVFTVHDPCVMRWEAGVQDVVRELGSGLGISIQEMKHSREKTVCCGEGGSVGFLNEEFAENWGDIRKKDAESRKILTYCAGCSASLNAKGLANHHILDLLYEVDTGKRAKVSRSPFTYLNRLRLKSYFRDTIQASVTRSRPRLEPAGYTTMVKRLLVLLMLVLTAWGIRHFHLMDHFTTENLRQTMQNAGIYAPILYIAIYAVAPALFLPGLPITLAGGILFGPFYGVIYSITGATIGATIAFLVARYLAGNWIISKLKGPKWRHLHEQVRRHGWKAVAFTRLIPLFPFNLLNYAFGLTPIPISHYVITSFFCMLPACIAYVVFSSSLLNVLSGRFSWAFVIGILLIVAVSSIPIWLKRRMSRKTDI